MKQITDNEVVYLYFKNVWNLQKFESLGHLIDENCTFTSSLGFTLKGKLQFTKYLYTFVVAFQNLYYEIDTVTENMGKINVKTKFFGDNFGTFFNSPPSYKKVCFKSTTIFEIKNRKIINIIDNIDIDSFNSQINLANIRLPI